MSRCANRTCRHPLPSIARFCPRCGHRVPRLGAAFLTALLIGFIGLGAAAMVMGLRASRSMPAAVRVDYDEGVSETPSPNTHGPHGVAPQRTRSNR